MPTQAEFGGQLFNEIAELVEKAKLRSTLTNLFSPINSANLRTPHAQIKSGRSFDKIVLAGWS
jgi:NADPH:quinone reductase